MQPFINDDDYSVVTQNELSTILATFDSAYIFSVIQDNLKLKYDNSFIGILIPNVVGSFEKTFQNLLEVYPMDHDNIYEVRDQTYDRIIEILCNEYKLSLNINQIDNVDKYTLAYWMYDMLVSNFSNYITTFFSRYIIQEKENLYNYFNLDAVKKNKDSSTIYGKKAYNDLKLAIINSHLLNILTAIQAFDITFEQICETVYADKNIISLLINTLLPTVDFYKTFYCEALRNADIVPIFITNIRLEIQKNQ